MSDFQQRSRSGCVVAMGLLCLLPFVSTSSNALGIRRVSWAEWCWQKYRLDRGECLRPLTSFKWRLSAASGASGGSKLACGPAAILWQHTSRTMQERRWGEERSQQMVRDGMPALCVSVEQTFGVSFHGLVARASSNQPFRSNVRQPWHLRPFPAGRSHIGSSSMQNGSPECLEVQG